MAVINKGISVEEVKEKYLRDLNPKITNNPTFDELLDAVLYDIWPDSEIVVNGNSFQIFSPVMTCISSGEDELLGYKVTSFSLSNDDSLIVETTIQNLESIRDYKKAHSTLLNGRKIVDGHSEVIHTRYGGRVVSPNGLIILEYVYEDQYPLNDTGNNTRDNRARVLLGQSDIHRPRMNAFGVNARYELHPTISMTRRCDNEIGGICEEMKIVGGITTKRRIFKTRSDSPFMLYFESVKEEDENSMGSRR